VIEPAACEAAETKHEQASNEFVLHLENGKTLALDLGMSIFGSDLGELGMGAAQAVAQVQGHPTRTHVRGLVNLSTHSWEVCNSQGDRTTISKGMTISLKEGLSIKFGSVSGTIRGRT